MSSTLPGDDNQMVSVAVGRALGGVRGIYVRPPEDVGETRQMMGDGRR